MIECQVCKKEFNTARGLFGHKRVHNKLGGSYSVSRKKNEYHPYNCLNCGNECKTHPSKINKYCSASCQQEFQWNDTKRQIEEGNKPANNRYITERDGYSCKECGISEWLGKSLTLDLDHIDGNPKNNSPDNLRLVCPNCHRQTPTWGMKKRS